MNLRIKHLREEAGMTQTDLAKALKKAPRTITAWELGESYPKADSIWAMAELFGTDPDDLMGWWEEHERPALAQALDPPEARLVGNYRASSAPARQALEELARTSALARGEAEEEAFPLPPEIALAA